MKRIREITWGNVNAEQWFEEEIVSKLLDSSGVDSSVETSTFVKTVFEVQGPTTSPSAVVQSPTGRSRRLEESRGETTRHKTTRIRELLQDPSRQVGRKTFVFSCYSLRLTTSLE